MYHVSNLEKVMMWRVLSQNRLLLVLFCGILLDIFLFNHEKPVISDQSFVLYIQFNSKFTKEETKPIFTCWVLDNLYYLRAG